MRPQLTWGHAHGILFETLENSLKEGFKTIDDFLSPKLLKNVYLNLNVFYSYSYAILKVFRREVQVWLM